jgi:hypothetical protein
MSIVDYCKTKGILHFLKKHDAVVWGRKCADIINTALDEQVGEKRSEAIQEEVKPWVSKFFKAFNAELDIL